MQTFIVLTEAGQSREIECREVMTIGREAGNDIVLDDPRVSRRHAVLYRTQDGSFYLADDGSSNGSFVNDARISLPTRLSDGDRIGIGAARLLFRQPAAAAHRAPPDSRPTTLVVETSVELLRMAILVADIRGFTQLSENMPARTLAEMMNRWFRESSQCVRSRDGIVDKFLGDCVYARWEANRDPAGVLLRVLDAACELNRITRRLNETVPNLPQPLRIGVGINIGQAAIGTDHDRTAIGDAVNLTFRLQEQTKTLGLPVLLNREAYLHLPPALWEGQERRIRVAGKTQPLDVWGLSFDETEHFLDRHATGDCRVR